jgi:hypothetical protein
MTDDGDVVLFVPVKRSEADAFETAAMDAGEAVIDVRGPDAIDLPESPSAFENTLVGCRASACSKANSFADSTTGRSPTRTDRVAGSNASSPTTRAPAAARPSARRSTARTRAWSSA